MYRRPNRLGNLWIAGILSAIFFCLMVAGGGSWRIVNSNVVSPMPYSGGTDVSHQPSTRFLVSPDRHVVVSTSSDKILGLDHGGSPGSAILPDEAALPDVTERPFVSGVQHALSGNGNSGYNARAPPALI
jgi:hypothetical protein